MWNSHFEQKEDIVVSDDSTFRVYFKNRDEANDKLLLVLLHDLTYSALSWAHFAVSELLISLN